MCKLSLDTNKKMLPAKIMQDYTRYDGEFTLEIFDRTEHLLATEPVFRGIAMGTVTGTSSNS